VALHWSGGNRSALALLELRRDDAVQVDRLVTAVQPARPRCTRSRSSSSWRRRRASAGPADADRPGLGLDGYVEPQPGGIARYAPRASTSATSRASSTPSRSQAAPSPALSTSRCPRRGGSL